MLRSMTDRGLWDIGVSRSGIEAAIRRHEADAEVEILHPAARPAFEKYGARFIVRGGAFETMEGSARDRNVVVEFVDRDAAMACYRSPEYQTARAIRQRYADTDFIIVEGAA